MKMQIIVNVDDAPSIEIKYAIEQAATTVMKAIGDMIVNLANAVIAETEQQPPDDEE